MLKPFDPLTGTKPRPSEISFRLIKGGHGIGKGRLTRLVVRHRTASTSGGYIISKLRRTRRLTGVHADRCAAYDVGHQMLPR